MKCRECNLALRQGVEGLAVVCAVDRVAGLDNLVRSSDCECDVSPERVEVFKVQMTRLAEMMLDFAGRLPSVAAVPEVQ